MTTGRADQPEGRDEAVHASGVEHEMRDAPAMNPLSTLSALSTSGDSMSMDPLDAVNGKALRAPRPYDAMAERAARSSCTMLLTGETGVGKGHFAKWIHRHSRRESGPFVPVNCGAIPESIIDSQLFGHLRGAFSGAVADHLGLVRAAAGGTLFLDEIGELPASAQLRLLRLLQEGEVQPVGRSAPLSVDVRVIAATNMDLVDAVENRRFRRDLLFRLDVVSIRVRALRDRVDEMPSLLHGFNNEFASLYGQAPCRFSDDALAALRSYAWPGNIRQLRTVVERMHVLCPDDLVTPAHLVEIGQLHGLLDAAPVRSIDSIRDTELERVLAEKGGSVHETALAFGVHRSTIYRWLRRRGRVHRAS